MLAFLNVSVTEQIAVPVPVGVPPDSPRTRSSRSSIAPAMADRTTPLRDQGATIADPEPARPSRACASSSRRSCPTSRASGSWRHVRRADGRRRRRGRGLMDALIRKLVAVSPRRLLAFILIFVGVLSSVASDAGYLILIPLGAAAFMSVGRHPLAGLAACFAGVGAIFGVNLLLGPDGRDDHRDHQRGARRWPAASPSPSSPTTASPSCRRSCWRSSARDRHRAHRSSRDWALDSAAGDGMSSEDEAPEVDPAHEARGLQVRGARRPSWRPRRRPAADAAVRRPAARPGDRRHHRQDAVHGQPAVHHHAGVPARRHRLRLRCQDVQRAPTMSSRP